MSTRAAFSTLAAAAALLSGAAPSHADPERLLAPTRYDTEYPVVDYSGPARANRVWRVQQQMQAGDLKLQWEPRFGYLRSLLKALQIDPDSQVLVFSRTSLQIEHISPQTPRAVYFNDDTYVGYVQDSRLVELVTVDSERGPVFYGFENQTEYPPEFNREGARCLTCHDTFSMGGGGVPRIMVMSSPVDDPADNRRITTGDEVDDRTPFVSRWGGWYATGNTGSASHLANLPLAAERGGDRLRSLRGTRLNPLSLGDYFDTSRYLTGLSDVVALAVLEHQTAMHNLVTRVSYKVRTVMSRPDKAGSSGKPAGVPHAWADVTSRDHQQLQQMIEPLVRALFLQDAAPLADRMAGSSGFAERFPQLGPQDSRGRSLRDLDLQQRVFRHRMSFEIYSAQLDALPDFALDYLYQRIVEVLAGRDTTGISASLSAAERQVLREILIDTKPALAQRLRQDASRGGTRKAAEK